MFIHGMPLAFTLPVGKSQGKPKQMDEAVLEDPPEEAPAAGGGAFPGRIRICDPLGLIELIDCGAGDSQAELRLGPCPALSFQPFEREGASR